MTQEVNSTKSKPHPYETIMLALCIYALVSFGADSLLKFDEGSHKILNWADTFICALFFLDFAVSFYRSSNRIKYFVTWGWIDLLSSIPMVDFLRIGRAARIFRIFRVFRGVRATKLIAAFILERRSESAFLAAALISLLLMVFTSVAVLEFEKDNQDANIKNAPDALWWSFVTITTVGYGDKYPTTTEGRLIGALLMTAGVGLFGTFSGFVAAWFLTPSRKKEKTEMESLLHEVKSLRNELQQMKKSDQLKRR